MPKYNQYQPREDLNSKKEKVHPIWRGIGCVLIVVIPILSYAAADLLIQNKTQFPWIIIPDEIVMTHAKDPLLLVKIVYAIIVTFILFLILSGITFLINKYFGGNKGS